MVCAGTDGKAGEHSPPAGSIKPGEKRATVAAPNVAAPLPFVGSAKPAAATAPSPDVDSAEVPYAQKLSSLLSGGFVLGEMGLHLKDLLMAAPCHLGEVSRLLASELTPSLAGGIVSEGEQDLMPLPQLELSAEEMRELYAEAPERKSWPTCRLWTTESPARATRLQQVVAWVWVVILALNYLYTGYDSGGYSHVPAGKDMAVTHVEAVGRIR